MTETAAPATAPVHAEPRREIGSLQVLRGFAAIAVAFYHAQIIMAQPEYGGITLLQGIATKGWLGVNFFFVLSGFVICYAHFGDIGKPQRWARYAWRRFSRVYPAYWVYLTAYIGAAAIGIGHPDFSWEPLNLLTSYALVLITPVPSLPLQPAWTLFYEVGFYILFSTLILNRRLGMAVMATWLTAVIIYSLILGHTGFGQLHAWNLYFLFGCMAFLAYRRLPGALGLPILGVGLAIFLAELSLGLVDDHLGTADKRPLMLLALATPFALILLGTIMLEIRMHWRAPALLKLLGNASYSIYLVHSPVLSVIAGIANRLPAVHQHPWLLYIAMVLLSVAAGLFAHLFVERPLLEGVRRLTQRRGNVPDAALARAGT